jgi:uncharacterized OB-fold protein
VNGIVVTYTVIHVSSVELGPTPYAVVVADTEAGRIVARSDGELSWLNVGVEITLENDPRFGFIASRSANAPLAARP